ncbi:MAG: YbjQ family protein [Ruminococcus sp.]|nr:YbjQ family protein [Ruminococcus sp.]
MYLFSIENLGSQKYQPISLVKGSTIQSKNMFKDMGQGFKSMVGGELGRYTKMMNEARDIATQRMVDEAQRMGADAIVGVRYSSSAIAQGAAEVMAIGTAVKFI